MASFTGNTAHQTQELEVEREPSMEEIMASIKQIIADDQKHSDVLEDRADYTHPTEFSNSNHVERNHTVHGQLARPVTQNPVAGSHAAPQALNPASHTDDQAMSAAIESEMQSLIGAQQGQVQSVQVQQGRVPPIAQPQRALSHSHSHSGAQEAGSKKMSLAERAAQIRARYSNFVNEQHGDAGAIGGKTVEKQFDARLSEPRPEVRSSPAVAQPVAVASAHVMGEQVIGEQVVAEQKPKAPVSIPSLEKAQLRNTLQSPASASPSLMATKPAMGDSQYMNMTARQDISVRQEAAQRATPLQGQVAQISDLPQSSVAQGDNQKNIEEPNAIGVSVSDDSHFTSFDQDSLKQNSVSMEPLQVLRPTTVSTTTPTHTVGRIVNQTSVFERGSYEPAQTSSTAIVSHQADTPPVRVDETALAQEMAKLLVEDKIDRLEAMISDLMRPTVGQWLQDNLSSVVEKLVREEIERVSRGRQRG